MAVMVHTCREGHRRGDHKKRRKKKATKQVTNEGQVQVTSQRGRKKRKTNIFDVLMSGLKIGECSAKNSNWGNRSHKCYGRQQTTGE